MISLREQLERIWQEGGCMHPLHITWWSADSGWAMAPGLFHKKGKLTGKAPPRPPVFPHHAVIHSDTKRD